MLRKKKPAHKCCNVDLYYSMSLHSWYINTNSLRSKAKNDNTTSIVWYEFWKNPHIAIQFFIEPLSTSSFSLPFILIQKIQVIRHQLQTMRAVTTKISLFMKKIQKTKKWRKQKNSWHSSTLWSLKSHCQRQKLRKSWKKWENRKRKELHQVWQSIFISDIGRTQNSQHILTIVVLKLKDVFWKLLISHCKYVLFFMTHDRWLLLLLFHFFPP